MVEPSQPEGRASGAAAEPSDVSVWGILAFAAGLVVLGGISTLLVWWMMNRYTSVRSEAPSWGGPSLAGAQEAVPPEPRLEGMETVGALREPDIAAEATAKSYGWVDRSKGIVRSPVDQAMNMLADRLPARPASAVPAGEDRSQMASPTNSGRTRERVEP